MKQARIVSTPCRVCVQLMVQSPIVSDAGHASLGMDVGITNRVTLSTGARYAKRTRPTLRLKKLQRSLSRKVKGSNSRMKARRMLAREHQRFALCERNAPRRLTSSILRGQSNKFYVESLNILSMIRNHCLAEAIHEQSRDTLVHQLTYKAENAGGWVRSVDPRNTSQICNACQRIPENRLTLSDRIYVCAHCGYTEDRDVNAAKNILRVGLLSDTPGGNSPAHGKNERQGALVETSYHAQQYVNFMYIIPNNTACL